MEEAQLINLVDWIQDHLDTRIVVFVPNHWHEDCITGLPYLHSLGIKSYAHELTVNIRKTRKLPVPQNSFQDSLVLKLKDKEMVIRYFGAGHTLDNTVAWIPSEKILFGGCMVKDLHAKGLGNIADANLKDWPVTLKKVWNEYKEASLVIPGHGAAGNSDLLLHSIELLKK